MCIYIYAYTYTSIPDTVTLIELGLTMKTQPHLAAPRLELLQEDPGATWPGEILLSLVPLPLIL